jgi:glycosyltransferase involved in cell wall biosynthesis
MKPRISAVINTLNEEKNLPFALRSVQSWVDEIIVVDMHSEDRTVEIAREFGAKVFFHERLDFADPARAFALEQATGDWILILDADEVIPLPLSRVLLNAARSGSTDAVRMPLMSHVLGTPLMHTNCSPRKARMLRFFRRHHVTATSTIHNYLHLVPGSRVLEIKYEPGLTIVHFAYFDSRHFIEKLNRYTNIEARQAFEKGKRITPAGALLRAAKEFAARYIKGRGFQDGWRGFYISLFYAFYRIVAAAKLHELTTFGGREQVEARYQQEAGAILKAYDEAPRPAAPKLLVESSVSDGQ